MKQNSAVNCLISCLPAALLLAVLLLLAAIPAPAAEPETVRIGIITDGPGQRIDEFVDLVRAEVEELLGETRSVSWPEGARVTGDWSPAGVTAALDRLAARDDIDLVISAGFAAASQAATRSDLPWPVAATLALDDLGTSDRFRSQPLLVSEFVSRDLSELYRLVHYEQLTVIADPALLGYADLEPLARRLDLDRPNTHLVAAEKDVAAMLEAIPADTDAVYVMLLARMNADEMRQLASGLIELGLPSFSGYSAGDVEAGILAGMDVERLLRQIARRTALDVQDLLDGGERTHSVSALTGERLMINMATAEAVGFTPDWCTLAEATLVDDHRGEQGRRIDLETAVSQAIAVNLDLAIKQREVAAGEQDVRRARSALLPQVDLGLSGMVSDSSHAMPSFGSYRAYAAGSLTLTQVLYSEDALAGLSVTKELQKALRADLDALRQDIARTTAGAYLDLLRADAAADIRREDLRLTRANLDLARVRRAVGSAGKTEVLRWEAELAGSRSSLLNAMALRRQAERQLSRLLNEPLETSWRPSEAGSSEGAVALADTRVTSLLGNPSDLDRLAAFVVPEGTAAAPELEALDAAILAQERELAAAGRSYYAPTVGLQAGVNEILAKDETGGPDLGDFADLIGGVPDTSWNVGLHVSLPLTTGGERGARKDRAEEEAARLRLDRRNAEQLIGQRIWSALDNLGASWPTIALRDEAAAAADETLSLVRDSYARGAASILDLLDARNAALTARLAAAAAVYDFLDDYAEARRAVAAFGPAMAEDESEAFLGRLAAYAAESR